MMPAHSKKFKHAENSKMEMQKNDHPKPTPKRATHTQAGILYCPKVNKKTSSKKCF